MHKDLSPNYSTAKMVERIYKPSAQEDQRKPKQEYIAKSIPWPHPLQKKKKGGVRGDKS